MSIEKVHNCPRCDTVVERQHRYCFHCGFALLGLSSHELSEESTDTGERRHITVMFCDLVGSTALSNQLDPEDLRDIMRAYQNAAVKAVTDLDGFVAKFLGDGILAYFGYPRAHEDDAERAVRAGLLLLDEVTKIETKGDVSLKIRVGISSGIVVVGELLSAGAASEQTVIGETPNLAARLQEIATENQIVVSEATKNLLQDRFDLEALGNQDLKGFSDPIPCFAILEEYEEQAYQSRRMRETSRYVGRAAERSLIAQSWLTAQSANGNSLLLVGEAGMGKSRLMAHVTDEAETGPRIRLRFQCSRYHQNTEYYPFIQQLRFAARLSDGDAADDQIAKLQRLLNIDNTLSDQDIGLFAQLLGIPGAPGGADLSPEQRRQKTVALFLEQIIGLSRITPVLLVFDDLHWIDASSLEVLNVIGQNILDQRVLILMGARPEIEDRQDIIFPYQKISLSGLDIDARRALISEIAGEAALSEEFVNTVISRTDGVPLYLEELTDSLLQSQSAEATEQLTDMVPTSLHDLFMEQLDRQGPARELAHAASILGRHFDGPLLRLVVGLPEKEYDGYLNQLIDAGIIHRSDGGQRDSYEFRHGLVQEAAYGTILRSRRRSLHGRAGDTLRAWFPETAQREPELMARHYKLADRPEDAISYFQRAGEKASLASANKEAASHYQDAIDLLQNSEQDSTENLELELRVRLGVALIAAYGYAAEEVVANYDLVREIDGDVLDHELYFAAIRGMWNFHFDRWNIPMARRYCDDLERLSHLGDHRMRRVFYTRAEGTMDLYQGRFQSAAALLSECYSNTPYELGELDLQNWTEDPGLVSKIYHSWALAIMGDLDGALELAKAGIEDIRTLNHGLSLGFGLGCYCFTLIISEKYGEAEKIAIEAYENAARDGLPFWQAWAKACRGYRDAMTAPIGEYGDAIERMIDGLREWEATSAGLHIPTHCMLVMDAALRHGDRETAARHGERGLNAAETYDELLVVAELYRLHGVMYAQNSDHQTAQSFFEKALNVSEQQGAHLFRLKSFISLRDEMENDPTSTLRYDGGDIGMAIRNCLTQFKVSKDLPLFQQATS